ncbi:uncharacterized protein GIQ15_01599 [Arthroderma uncinatum]|uniref:uncharacterized protein n=1 Tax=Arthroderma uncinatum TaxID=74035 RepID=UPI00144A9339|nr:uncharacterized protein GIQ15_01599 [Arthroderma uncinatum]KAF3492082.1 hypothetical protein GIQ15_01599 [Arthroderma uncinatum]
MGGTWHATLLLGGGSRLQQVTLVVLPPFTEVPPISPSGLWLRTLFWLLLYTPLSSPFSSSSSLLPLSLSLQSLLTTIHQTAQQLSVSYSNCYLTRSAELDCLPHQPTPARAVSLIMATLTKVDSAIAGLPSPAEAKKASKKVSSSSPDVMNIKDLEGLGIELQIAPETQKLNWKLNTSPSSLEDKDVLKKFLTTPPVKKIDLNFPLGLAVTARNLKGVTIKDSLDAIYKQFRKKADDELDNPILAGFEWDKEESWTRLIVHQKKEGAPAPSKKSKKKGAAAAE